MNLIGVIALVAFTQNVAPSTDAAWQCPLTKTFACNENGCQRGDAGAEYLIIEPKKDFYRRCKDVPVTQACRSYPVQYERNGTTLVGKISGFLAGVQVRGDLTFQEIGPGRSGETLISSGKCNGLVLIEVPVAPAK